MGTESNLDAAIDESLAVIQYLNRRLYRFSGMDLIMRSLAQMAIQTAFNEFGGNILKAMIHR